MAEEDEGFVIEFTPDAEFIKKLAETRSSLMQVKEDLQLTLDALNEANEAGVEMVEAANRVLTLVPDEPT
jgi:hypothetical protein